MKKAVWSAVVAASLVALASPANAQLATAQINATVDVNSLARLVVSGDVNFASADPDAVNPLVANDITVSARARVAPTQDLVVTVHAGNDWFDPATQTIPVSGLEWTVSGGAPWVPGTMSTSPVTLAQWTGPANQSTTQTYTLPNLWTYAPGTHTVVLTYTLATP